MENNIKRGFGWKPELPDLRDVLYQSPRIISALSLPSSVDLTKLCPPVYDQGSLGSCVANAIGAAYQIAQTKQGKQSKMPSRLFIYYNARVLIGTTKYDSGSTLRDGIKTVAKQGVALEELWPYNIPQFTKKPTIKVYNAATKALVTSYSKLTNTNLNQLKSCLAEGFPFVFGFTVYDYFESQEMAKTGELKLPNISENVLGGHAVIAVGYDDAKQSFLVRNSWGSKWGINGYFWMPYTYITNPKLASDFWTIRIVTN